MTRSKILMIAGFGDNSSMYDSLQATDLAEQDELVPLDLPGFGAEPLGVETTLATLAQFVAEKAKTHSADTIIAHSVASIIASLAARTEGSPLNHVISLEGNLTAEDAYFSGRAAEHVTAASFRDWFLPRLTKKCKGDPILARYAEEVAKADPKALWELGCDAKRFSDQEHPGETLRGAGRVTYIFNPDNCPESSVAWLSESGINSVQLPGASHWPTLDKPNALSRKISETLRD
ncbi:MAG: alpha/beta hydrolase [Pseudomonadota bacterium]